MDMKELVRTALYQLGILGSVHKLRNKNTLTTLMFHRVLPVESQEYANAEREFTFTTDGFDRCLDFVKKHYNVVRLQDVLDAASGNRSLPPCAALITFDDGWRDTILHAAPKLKSKELSAVLFLSTEVLSSSSDRWWQDALVSVLANPAATTQLAKALGVISPDLDHRDSGLDRLLAGKLALLSENKRFDLLAAALPDVSIVQGGRQMLTEADIAHMDRSCIELAAHGHTHAPLTELDLQSSQRSELQLSFNIVSILGAKPVAMSFPHGAHDLSLLQLAKSVGFQMLFTSKPTLFTACATRGKPLCIGRIHVPENRWTTNRKGISFPLLATYLFFRSLDTPAIS